MNKLFTLFLALSATIGAFSQMNGSYTVGGIAPDFATVGGACTQIETDGISGPVTINIRDGVYADSIYLTAISGVSATNTITFQSESMDASDVEITNGNQAPAYLNGETVDFITIQHLTLTTTNSGDVIYVLGGVNNFSLNNCVVNGFSSTSSSSANAVIRIRGIGSDNDMITISNNIINNGSFGVYFRNYTILADISIVGNTFYENYYHNVYLNNFGDIHVADNIINSSLSSASAANGIKLEEGIGNMVIERNEIYRTNQSDGTGISIENIAGNAVFKNNIVSMPGLICNAVYMDYIAADEIAFYNNTFRVGSDIFSGYADVEFDIYNNILISTGGGTIYELYSNSVTFAPAADNNVYYTTGDFAYLDWPYNDTYAALSDYQAAIGQENNTFEIVDYQFVDNVLDLHTCNDSLMGSGYFLPSVVVDVDGEPRSVNSSSIGADYFNIDGTLWNGVNLEACLGTPLILDAGAADSYLWSTMETTPTISAGNFGQYSVEWTNVCGTYYDTVVINDITPVADFTSTQSFLTFQFANTSQNGTSYLWDFGDGNTSTEINPTHVYNDENTYTVTLTVTNSCGSDDTTMQITPSIVGLNDLSVQADVIAFPNPTKGDYTLKINGNISNGADIVLMDLNGSIVKQTTTFLQTTKLNLSDLARGTYILSVKYDGLSTQKRVIKF